MRTNLTARSLFAGAKVRLTGHLAASPEPRVLLRKQSYRCKRATEMRGTQYRGATEANHESYRRRNRRL